MRRLIIKKGVGYYMKKFVRIVCAFVLICCLFGAVGCGNKYNAELFNDAEQWIRDDFLRENRVKAFYPNENYDEYDEQSESYIYDETAPLTRTFIISDDETFNAIFKGNDIAVNFENEMLLLYIHPEIYAGRDYSLKKITVEGKKINISVELEKRNGVGDASMPSQSCLLVKMDRIEIDSAEFIEQ